MSTLDKKKIADRLREFIGWKFDNMPSKLAKSLGISHQALQTAYLTGQSIPGPALLVKLLKLGCDIIWLLTEKKDFWNYGNIDVQKRIGDLVDELHKKYSYPEGFKPIFNANFTQKTYDEYNLAKVWEHWTENRSLSPIDLTNLATAFNVSLFWILTGWKPDEKITNKNIVSPKPYSDISIEEDLMILRKLKSIPEYKESILKLIDSKVSEKEALQELKK